MDSSFVSCHEEMDQQRQSVELLVFMRERSNGLAVNSSLEHFVLLLLFESLSLVDCNAYRGHNCNFEIRMHMNSR